MRVAVARLAVSTIDEPSNKGMKQTSVCPSFARAPGASGALTLAAYPQCWADNGESDPGGRNERGPTVNVARPVKLIIGILTLWPFVYIMFFSFAVSSLTILSEGPSHTGSMPLQFRLLAATHLATILLMFGLMAFYIVFLFKTNRVAADKKALWAVVLFLGGGHAGLLLAPRVASPGIECSQPMRLHQCLAVR